jgi:hypothetical protein
MYSQGATHVAEFRLDAVVRRVGTGDAEVLRGATDPDPLRTPGGETLNAWIRTSGAAAILSFTGLEGVPIAVSYINRSVRGRAFG